MGCDSEATVEHGLTKVEGWVCGPRDPNETAQASNPNTASSAANQHLLNPAASIHVHISATPFGSIDGKKTRRTDKKFADLAASIQHTFEPIVLLDLYPRSSIDIYILVIHQDGGLLQAAINVTTLALVGAGVSIRDYVTSVSIGAISTPPSAMLDLTNTEQTDLTNLTIAVLPRTEKLTLVQLDTRINLSTFESLLHIGLEACLILYREMDIEVQRWTCMLRQQGLPSLDHKYLEVHGFVSQQNPRLMAID